MAEKRTKTPGRAVPTDIRINLSLAKEKQPISLPISHKPTSTPERLFDDLGLKRVESREDAGTQVAAARPKSATPARRVTPGPVRPSSNADTRSPSAVRSQSRGAASQRTQATAAAAGSTSSSAEVRARAKTPTAAAVGRTGSPAIATRPTETVRYDA